MDIEKTYQLMNKLEMFKRFLDRVKYLRVIDSKSGNFIGIHVSIVDQLNGVEELINEIKELLIPVFDNRIKELEEEIKSK